jgi:hypothetical protein
MKSEWSTENPRLTEAQYRTLQTIAEITSESQERDYILSSLYQKPADPEDPLYKYTLQVEEEAQDYLLEKLMDDLSQEEVLVPLTMRLKRNTLAGLRRTIRTALETAAKIAPTEEDRTHDRLAIQMVKVLHEIQMRQAGPPVNPVRIQEILCEALHRGKPLKIVLIGCLAHTYENGYQEIISIYENGGLRKKEQEIRDQLLLWQNILTALHIPYEIVLAIADTDIPYQRGEPAEGQKWNEAQAQIAEIRDLYKDNGISVVSMMEEIGRNGLKLRHDEVYETVRRSISIYVPDIYMERRVNKRYDKYNPLEGMDRARARDIVVNSYADEAAKGAIWEELWGPLTLHMVYKTTYLSAAMEAYRNARGDKRENLPTIYITSQRKIDDDGEE